MPSVIGATGEYSLNLSFHHVGLACRHPKSALFFAEGMGYTTTRRVFDPLQNVNLIMCEHPNMPSLEIVYPGERPGPIDLILDKVGESLYHTCYETPDLASTLHQLKSAGQRVICVSPPQPAILFDGRQVSFYRVKGVGLIELLEP